MCWIGKNNPQIATEDIKVFKIFKYKHGDILSPVMPMQWKRGELAPHVEIPDSLVYTRIIDEGYHSCRDLKIVPNYFDGKISPFREASFSSFRGVLIMSKQERFIMLTCIIPKGTKYYKNEYGEIVSETIKIL